jgi:hypothetical protein
VRIRPVRPEVEKYQEPESTLATLDKNRKEGRKEERKERRKERRKEGREKKRRKQKNRGYGS